MKRWTRCVVGACIAALIVALSAPAIAREVTATATSTGEGEAGKKAATSLALKKAIEGACATFLRGQRGVQDFGEVLERVLSDTSGYASDVRVEATYEEPTWTATASADVSPEKFARVWKQTYIRVVSPRLMVTVTELRDGQKQDASVVQSGVAKYLLRKGFRMVDKEHFDEVKEARLKEAALNDDLASVAAIARDVGADLLLVGDVRADKGQEEEVGGYKFQFYTAQASLKVVQADSASLVVRERAKGKGGSRDAGTAATKALEQVAGQIAGKIWKACLDNWDKVVPSSFRCQLDVAGMTAQNVLAVEKALKKVNGVTSVKLRDMREGTAQFDIVTTHHTRKFFTVLVGTREVSELIEVTGMTNRRIAARWKERRSVLS